MSHDLYAERRATFEDFSQVSDAEVIAILQHSGAMATPGASHDP